MGILFTDAQLLIGLAKRRPLGKTVTLGRQKLFFHPNDVRKEDNPLWDRLTDGGPAEPFFQILGASEVSSLDFSDYEGATLLHDLNEPVPTELHGKFDTVFDGGTLEHVFNFPVALRNAMEMVREGGLLVISTPMNNLSGHGFYQFSPELFFNVLGEVNGFEIEIMAAHELSPAHRVFSVSNPAELKCRVELSNSWPTLLFVAARRVQRKKLFQSVPQQSDYTQSWNEGAVALQKDPQPSGQDPRAWAKSLRRTIQCGVPRLTYLASTFYRVFLNRSEGFENRKFFHQKEL